MNAALEHSDKISFKQIILWIGHDRNDCLYKIFWTIVFEDLE